MTISQESLYSVLNCDQSATFEELKASYQQLIKQFHPDKCSNKENASCDRFQEIDSAWKILRDPESRKQYDATLLQEDLDERPLIYAKIAADELEFDSECVAHFPCRCGSSFVINKTDLCDKEVIIECSECTNCLSVT